MVDGAKEAAVGGAEVRGQRQGCHARQVLVARWRVGKLDCDGVKAALRYVVVQLLNGTLRLTPLVKPDEANALGQA